jgi:hypothetical protein
MESCHRPQGVSERAPWQDWYWRLTFLILTTSTKPLRRGVFKGVNDDRRPPALQAGHPRTDRKAVSRVAPQQGVEGSGMAGPGETLESPWIPLSIQAWLQEWHITCHWICRTDDAIYGGTVNVFICSDCPFVAVIVMFNHPPSLVRNDTYQTRGAYNENNWPFHIQSNKNIERSSDNFYVFLIVQPRECLLSLWII